MAYKLGLIGYPLGHSISAVIHKAGLESLGIEGNYELLETPPEDLISRIKFLKSNDYNGFNVTIPLKVPIALFLDHVDRIADVSGCANTIKILSDKTFHGYNTDVYGFQKAIPSLIQKDLQGANVSILGTGGASRAAAVGLIELGVKQINFYSRNIINSSNMVNYLRTTFPDVVFKLYQNSSTGELFNSAIIVNTTPIGMKGHSADKMPLGLDVISKLPPGTVIYDVIYNPVRSLLLEKSKEYGLETINGLDMLLHQAAKSQEIWIGKLPDVDKMKIAALENL
ncbi:MAG: shikimate dehydrogenase [Candidatus Gastranaerophilales bacterium]|nr:shikimate dehydrogenase [Candidatus Gastranaerophilales bacterium]